MTYNEEIENIRYWFDNFCIGKSLAKDFTSFMFFCKSNKLTDTYYDFGTFASDVLGLNN